MNELAELLERRSMGRATYEDLKRIDSLHGRAFWLARSVVLTGIVLGGAALWAFVVFALR